MVRNTVSGPYRRIIVGVGLSARSRQAAAFALGMARAGEVYLLHAIHVPFDGFIHDPRIHRETASARRAELDRMTWKLRATAAAGGLTLAMVKDDSGKQAA